MPRVNVDQGTTIETRYNLFKSIKSVFFYAFKRALLNVFFRT